MITLEGKIINYKYFPLLNINIKIDTLFVRRELRQISHLFLIHNNINEKFTLYYCR